MVNEQNLIHLIENKKAQIVEIREIEKQDSYRINWIAKTFLSKTYCCKNTLCGCSCPKTKCECKNPEVSFYEDRGQKVYNATVSGGTSWGGAGKSIDGEVALFQDTRHDGDLKLGTISAGVDEVQGIGHAVRAGVNLIHFKGQGLEAKVGLNVDTGGSINANGVELKAGGLGFSIGKQTGISTPFGEVKVDTEDCVIQ